jgi:hypothetical protein
MFLVEHDNRVVVTFNWWVNYLTGKRSTRIIAKDLLPFFKAPVDAVEEPLEKSTVESHG